MSEDELQRLAKDRNAGIVREIACRCIGLLAERDQLRERVKALREYVEHRPSCDALKMFADDPDNDEWKPTCTCGLATLLARPETKPEER